MGNLLGYAAISLLVNGGFFLVFRGTVERQGQLALLSLLMAAAGAVAGFLLVQIWSLLAEMGGGVPATAHLLLVFFIAQLVVCPGIGQIIFTLE